MELNCKANEKIIKNLDERVKTLEEGGGGGGVSLTTETDHILIMLMTAEGVSVDASNIDNYMRPNGEVLTELMLVTQYATQINLKPPIARVITTDCTIVASKIRVTLTELFTPLIYKAIKEDNGSCQVTNYIFTSE